jgi:hypothetical protein
MDSSNIKQRQTPDYGGNVVMKRLVFITIMALVVGICGSACADLYDRGGGLIYDSDLNITWYDFTYTDSQTTGDAWARAVAWAAGLNVDGITGWRLPTTPGTSENNDSEGEMGHLYYVDGMKVVANKSPAPFQNITTGTYWYGTEYNAGRAWNFGFITGDQDQYYKTDHYYFALAVHSGDVRAPLPIPGDFAPADCDIDGSDLAALIASPGSLDVTTFAHNFGKTTTVGCSI